MTLMKMSPAPHERSEVTTASLMGKVLIAMTPALIWACLIFGLRSLSLTLISVASCVAFEYIFALITKRESTIHDLSAIVTGVLIAFNMPVSAPLWLPVFGAFFAIIVVKCIFGGIGKNIVNPALAARVFMTLSWTDEMTAFTKAGSFLSPVSVTADRSAVELISSATPLVGLKEGVVSSELTLMDMLLGNMPGCLGEVSALLLLAGGIYLIFEKVITWHIPVVYIGTVAAITFLLPHGADAFSVSYMLSELLSGGLILGAVFMATDYVTSPITGLGKVIYAVGCGLLTVFIRYFGAYSEGVSYSILIMNLFVWYIDRLTKPKIFGGISV